MTTSDFTSDDAFFAAFNDCSAPPSAFNHLGHIRIGWIHLQRYPVPEAVQRTCDGIERFANHLGAPGKYNRTLSEALMIFMAHGGAADRKKTWHDFLEENPQLVKDALGLLARHYSNERLNSDTARKTFMPPDLNPLP
jgi:N-formylglutamate deformylase